MTAAAQDLLDPKRHAESLTAPPSARASDAPSDAPSDPASDPLATQHSALLLATLEATADGILVVSYSGHILFANRLFQHIWRIPDTLMATQQDEALLTFVCDQLIDPSSFLRRVQSLYASQEPEMDTLLFKDGRTLERFSMPITAGDLRARAWSFRDVTAREEARAALEQERRQQRQLIHSLPALVWYKDLQGRYVTVNTHMEKLLGLSDAKLIGKEDQDLFPPELATRMKAADQAIFSRMTAPIQEVWLAHADGTTRHYEITRSPLLSPQGTLLGVLGIGHDITTRTLAERALRESEADLQRAQAVAHVGSWTMLFPKLELKWSDETYRMFGLPHGMPLTEQHFFECVHPEDRPAVAAAWTDALKGHPYSVPHRIQLQDTLRWVHEQAEVLFDAQGNPTHATGTVRDITQQVMDHQALLESEQRYRAIFDEAGIGIARVALDGTWLEANPKLCAIVGYPCEELLTLRVQDINHPEDMELDQALRTECIQGLRSRFTLEKRYIRKHGDFIWVHVSVTLVRPLNGTTPFFIAVIEDIHARKLAEQALRQSENRLRILIERFPGGVLVEDGTRHITLVNQTFCTQFQIPAPAEALIGFDCSHSAQESQHLMREPGPFITRIDDILAARLPALGDAVHMRDGRVLERDYIPVLDEARLVGHCWIYRDITARMEAEERLRLAANVFTHADEGIIITDPQAHILDVNEAFTRITGYSREEALGRKPSFLSSGHHPASFYASLWATLHETGRWNGELWNRHKDGSVFIELLTISAVEDAHKHLTHYVGLFTDITSQKEQQRQLERLAHYDALTSLPNRVLLHDRLQNAILQTQRRPALLAVVYVDLDGFKAVNDAHGHAIGDQLLSTVATRMRQALRETDTIARLGGDEFVAVLVDLKDTDSSLALFNRMLGAASQPVLAGNLTLQVSASLGVTFYPQAEEVDADQLLRQADHAMYQAKIAGRNRFHIFDQELDRSVRGHHESIQHIERGLERQQFLLYYQPKVNMRTGEVLGVEALLRWQHPTRGLLLPAEFLPALEDNPLSLRVSEWILEVALTQVEAWAGMGLHLPISINLGGAQIQRHDFVQGLKNHLQAHPNAPACSIELEVLETSALQELEHVSSVISQCAALGIRFSLDDFGTGYSSLTYLKRLPAHYLKIDQSFVRDMLDDPDDLAILEGVLGLASAFRRKAIAEGVETEEHGQMLLMLGCELGQGFGIARPMPAEKIPAWVARWQPPVSWQSQLPLAPALRSLLHAGVEHRAWVRMMEEYVNAERPNPPQLDPTACRVGAWLAGSDSRFPTAVDTFQRLRALHLDVHAIGDHMVELSQKEQRQTAHALLPELILARDSWLTQLAQALHTLSGG